MARRPTDRRSPPHRSRTPPLQPRALVDVGLLHVQLVHIDELTRLLGLVAGVRHRGAQRLVDRVRSPLLRMPQDRVRLTDAPTPNQIDHEAHLARALPDIPADGSGFHGLPTSPLVNACRRAYLRARGTGASARTRPACDPPCSR